MMDYTMPGWNRGAFAWVNMTNRQWAGLILHHSRRFIVLLPL